MRGCLSLAAPASVFICNRSLSLSLPRVRIINVAKMHLCLLKKESDFKPSHLTQRHTHTHVKRSHLISSLLFSVCLSLSQPHGSQLRFFSCHFSSKFLLLLACCVSSVVKALKRCIHCSSSLLSVHCLLFETHFKKHLTHCAVRREARERGEKRGERV